MVDVPHPKSCAHSSCYDFVSPSSKLGCAACCEAPGDLAAVADAPAVAPAAGSHKAIGPLVALDAVVPWFFLGGSWAPISAGYRFW